MTDAEQILRLAGLIVEALQVGTRKREWDVLDELFAAFGLELDPTVEHPQTTDAERAEVRVRMANTLAGAVPSTAALLDELLVCGGRFVAMLGEVYERLTVANATTSGGSETFVVKRGDLDEQQLTISPAFIEKVRRLHRTIAQVGIGRLDEEGLARFISADNGELYGRWSGEKDTERRLADAVLLLPWLRTVVDGTQRAAVERARVSAERLVTSAEWVIHRHQAHLDLLADADPAQVEEEVLIEPMGERRRQSLVTEIERYRDSGFLGTSVDPRYMAGLPESSMAGLLESSMVGLYRDLRPAVVEIDGYRPATGIGDLAGFVAMWRLGMFASRSRIALEPLVSDPAGLATWLEWVTLTCGLAADWLDDRVLQETGSVETSALLEEVEEYLNLPLWRHRDLLYEIWLLCVVLAAAEGGGWRGELAGLRETSGVWVFAAAAKVAELVPDPLWSDAALLKPLDIWSEPALRGADDAVVTPDLVVRTPGPLSRSLLVVEAKDREQFPSGRPSSEPVSVSVRRRLPSDSALRVGRRYAGALRAQATWVCNHCDFADPPDPADNFGDAWTELHLASAFRPGNVPGIFADSVRRVLRPWCAQLRSSAGSGGPLTVVLDLTASMAAKVDPVWESLLSAEGTTQLGDIRVVVYGDHGDNEPFLTRKLGPFATVSAAREAVSNLASADGGDPEEALEDAVQRCRELVDDLGPHTVVIATDAPPHRPEDCPYGIDLRIELTAVLQAGATVYALADLGPNRQLWREFVGVDGFHAVALRDLADRIRDSQRAVTGT
ncbi:MAG: hypothetical protein L0H96_11115 [Humibacillus sp.]|nr:hypothetical protein [Humibacillus sp.]MDN5777452.1 hypothetical protein [Humibacillus sp.]